MRKIFEFLIFCLALCAVECCMTDSECMVDQCCNNYHGPMIVSKRESSLLTQVLPETGHCENFTHLHKPCSPLEKANGHCSCYPGLTCQFVPASTPVTLKRKIYFPGPGAYRCEPTI